MAAREASYSKKMLRLLLLLMTFKTSLGVNNIYLAGFFPNLDNVNSSERGVLASIDLALKHINQSPEVLTDYKLHILWNNTQVLNLIHYGA